MHNASRVTQITALTLAIAGALAFGQAQASGFQLRENSVKNLGRANTGTATASDDASVATNNPAAMVNFSEAAVQVDVSGIDLTADFSGSGTTAVGTPLSGGDGGDPGDLTAVPALAAVFPLDNGLVLGASINAPFGLKTKYDADWVGRYNAIESDVKIVDLTLSAGLAITERFSVGAGLIYQRAEVTLSNAIDFGTALCAGSGNPANCFNPAYPFRPQSADGMVKVKGDDNGIGWVAGFQWKPSDNFTLGYAHHSEIDHDLEGDADFTKPAAVEATFAALGVAAYNDGPITAPLTTPSTDVLSARFDINDSFRLMADIQRTDWHSLKSVNIYRRNAAVTPVGVESFDWDDTMYYGIGGEWDMSDAFTLRAGVAIDESPTNNDTRTPRLPDNDRNLYSIGMTWRASEALSIDAAYQRIEIDTPKVDVASSSSSRLVGKFDGYANLFGVAAQYKF